MPHHHVCTVICHEGLKHMNLQMTRLESKKYKGVNQKSLKWQSAKYHLTQLTMMLNKSYQCRLCQI